MSLRVRLTASVPNNFWQGDAAHDVLSAVEAAFEWGIEEVTINDSHNTMINLDVSAFPSSTQIISGSPKILGMVDGVGEADVAFFMGYHAMAGTEKAVLDHTYDSKVIFDMEVMA